MKKIINYTFIISAWTVLTMSTGCHKVTTSQSTALIGFHMHTSIDVTQLDPVVYNAWYPDATGRTMKLSLAQFYLTNVSFRNSATQQWYTIPNSIILKRIQNELYVIGSVPAGSYDDIRFTIGLNNTLNSAQPSSYSTTSGADTVLSTIEQSVMWGSGMMGMSGGMASGYTFMNIQGSVDSTHPTAFSYQLGGYGDTMQVTMPVSAFTLLADQPQVVQYIHIIADYGKLLQNVPVATTPIGSFYNNSTKSVAASIWANIVSMFSYECTTPNGDC